MLHGVELLLQLYDFSRASPARLHQGMTLTGSSANQNPTQRAMVFKATSAKERRFFKDLRNLHSEP